MVGFWGVFGVDAGEFWDVSSINTWIWNTPTIDADELWSMSSVGTGELWDTLSVDAANHRAEEQVSGRGQNSVLAPALDSALTLPVSPTLG